VLFLLFFALPLSGADFGLSLIQTPELSGESGDNSFLWKGTGAPWFSALVNENLRFYVSGAVTADYSGARIGDDQWRIILELYRLEGIFQLMPGRTLTVGRTEYQDGLGLIAKGNFDGLKYSMDLGRNQFSAGAFYTGFQYKENPAIAFTEEDYLNRSLPPDYDDLDTYFASRRGLFFLRGDFPELFTERGTLLAEVLGQVDFTDSKQKLHSQYLSAAYRLNLRRLDLTLGGAAELIEEEERDPAMGFAASLDLKWAVPTAFQDRFDLGVLWASGNQSDAVTAFEPLSSTAQSYIFQPRLSSLLMLRGAYEFRLLQSLSMGFEAFYFFRIGESFLDPAINPAADSKLLGPELYGRINWNPVTDFSLMAGGGVFLPGPVYENGPYGADGTKPRWKFFLTTIFSL
jgi:hypothetical protein